MNMAFDHRNPRYSKARLARHLDKSWKRLPLGMAAFILLLMGVTLLATAETMGWAFVGLSVVPAMLLEWWKGELKVLPPKEKQTDIVDILAGDVLSWLPENPTVKDIATAAGKVNGGLFFGARFGVAPAALRDIVNGSETIPAESVWQNALELRQQLNSPVITAGMLIPAIVKQLPHYDELLARLRISYQDLVEGVRWQIHLDKLREQHARPRRTGGIARDWSFGFTPLLTRFGHNVSQQVSRGGMLSVELEAHQEVLDKLIDVFGSGGRQNAVLVGPVGVGKTTIINVMAERLLDGSANLPSSLKFRQIVMLDAGSLLSAAKGKGDLETLITRIFNEAYAAKNVIICLDNAELFFEDGTGSIDLSNILLPILEAGRLRIILTMNEQRLLQISQRNPNIANALNRINVPPTNEAETMLVMQDQLIITEFHQHVMYTYQSLGEIYRLSQRYIHDIAMPGRALKLMEAAAAYSDNGLVTVNSVAQAIEKTMDIKVGTATGNDEREKLLNLEELIHRRMVNQKRAVQVVSDALRRARAGVRNENRPIGTFLFLGPTGVGKTELAKALADAYFGGEERIVRLDLNEFVRSEDVVRLIADGADDPMSLTAQAMKQPFSVVLLDEIEKAHPNVLTTLLQMLDEGILRDVKNREVSFRDAIIICTSNAGADRIRDYIQQGLDIQKVESQFVDELISSNQFKPEFLNRFDEMVVFTPLSKPDLLQVIDLIIAGVNRTLSPQKITVSVSPDAKELLVERGYDVRLGARPMRRVVQRAIENTVARSMLSGDTQTGGEVAITREQVEQALGAESEATNLR